MKKMDGFTKSFVKDSSESGSLEPVFNEEEVTNIKQSLHKLHHIWGKDAEALEKSCMTTKASYQIMPKSPLSKDNLLNPSKIFGERLAAYWSQFIAKNQEGGLL
jgi:hypothetical protein